MKSDEEQEQSSDSWSLLAKELLGEEVESKSSPPRAPAEERIQQAGESPPAEPPEPPIGAAPGEEIVEQSVDVDAAAPFDQEHSDRTAGQIGPRAEQATESTEEVRPDEQGTEADQVPSGEPAGRRPRRGGRRRRRSRRSADGKPEEQTSEPDESDATATLEEEIVNVHMDIEEVTVPESESTQSNERSNAIPTWSEAISYLSRGPEEPPKKDGTRPKRRRRRSKS